MKKFVTLFFVIAGLAAGPLTQAGAHGAQESTVTLPISGITAVWPATMHLDETVIIEHHRHYYHHHHYHHRYYYRHGVRHFYD